ncbi:MAG TPA: mechanosensitive ion channel domain-containing protein [Candidatus Saccharimonadales bacterium]|jgi:small-conductance mechanosensitive channel
MHKHIWRRASFRLVPYGVLSIAGATISLVANNAHGSTLDRRLVAALGMLLFVIFAVAFLHVLSSAIHGMIASHRLGAGRAAAMQFILRAFGYIVILLIALELLGVPVGRLILGGAALGIVLGVAAQQALANFFASFVLVISHPFMVGQHVTLNSGALGGEYAGTVAEVGLTHTRLKLEDGTSALLPNATLLSGAAISVQKPKPASETSDQPKANS